MSETLRVALFFTVASVLGAASLASVRTLYPDLWARPSVRRVLLGTALLYGATALLAPIARALDLPRELRIVLLGIAGVGIVFLGLMAPFLAAGAWLARRLRAGEPPLLVEPSGAPDVDRGWTRRELGVAGARLLPLGGASLAGVGAGGGAELAQVVELRLTYPDLPPDLEGLRILQLSDVHLGYFVDLDEIASLAEQGSKARADLVVLTGDIADDLARLPRALELLSELAPRLGTYASIGNHEYFRGIAEARRAYDRSRVPLLIERGHTISVGAARLHLSGADDPRFLGRQNDDFFRRTVARSLDGAPSDAFQVLMSHRPEGFQAAKRAGVHLTLAGHTHGGQVGLAGRSILEPLLPEKYLWGHYREGGSRLYTSSGAGHWFPFRLGCPRELPVIELARGPLDLPVRKVRV